MPKGIDPKAYAARITKAKKTVAAMDPATKAKLEQYYPKVTKESIANKALSSKATVAKKAAAKPMTKTVTKTTTKKTLTGPAAIAEIQRRTSPAGVKKAEMDAKKAIAKKYPGLTKKSK